MQYILMLHAPESGWTAMTEAQQQQAMGAFYAYTEALKKAGVLKSVSRLQPSSTTTTVRAAGGKSQVLNGPYVDSKSSWEAFTSSTFPICKPRFIGLNVVLRRCMGRWKYVRCGLKLRERAGSN